MLNNSKTSYGSVTKVLHWLVFFLVVGMLCLGFLLDDINDKPLHAKVVNIHKLIGLLILALMLFRALWAFSNPKPGLPLNTPSWQKYAERSVHWLIYLALIAMPISGWIMSVAAGYAPHLFDISFNLPIAKNKVLGDRMYDTHVFLAYSIIVLVSIHVCAALYHYLIKKDSVLQRMM